MWKNLPNTECNQRSISIQLNSIATAYIGYSASELLQSSTCSLKKQGTRVFRKFHPERADEKLSVPLNYYLVNGAHQQANGFYECVRRKTASNLGKAMGKGECQRCFGKKRKNSAFLPNTARKKMAKSPKNHSKPFNGFFKFSIDLEPVVVLHKNRINPTKRCGEKYIHRDESRQMSRVGKNEINFTSPSANKLRSARPANALHLKSTLARMLIYDRAYPEKH